LDSTLAKKILPPVSDTAEGLRVLDITLPQYAPPSSRGEALVPPAEEFAHLCLDKPFLQTLRAVAIGALHGMPVALEGDTAASKTTAVRFLAHHLNQPILRLNLNGQSDPGEIVGRYVPLEASSLLDSTLLETAPAWLSEKSKCILQTAKAMKRPLSPLEKSVIAAAEGLTSASFRFHEGFLPTAMRNGWWLLLDEVNLAESHVLERLNSALETPPSLALTEGDGTVLGANGTPIQRGFHIFATMNPADYSGRNTLSPAFRDRFGIWHQSALPQEQEIYQMLVAATQGKQPEITIGQVTYQAPTSKPAYPHWQNLNSLNTTLERIATFHAGIAKSSGVDGSTPSLGRHRKERYTFTRRTLLNLLAFVNSSLEGKPESAKDDTLVQQGLRMFYLNKVSDPADRRAIVNILKAATL
jgi:MoxR-like ATPase